MNAIIISIKITKVFVLLFSFFYYHIILNAHISQIHIAQGKTPDIMMVSWVTKSYSGSTVWYGLNKTNINIIEYGYQSSYHFDYPEIDVYQSGFIHHVELIV